MISAAEAREITDDFNGQIRAKESVENLTFWIKEQALNGKDYLIFTIEHSELEDFIVQEFKNFGYRIFKQDDHPIYIIYW